MPIKQLHKAPFAEETFYHVYNRCVKKQSLFYIDENYKYFLKLFDRYLSGVSKVYSWTLIPNHFHFLISIKLRLECIFSDKEKHLLLQNPFSLDSIIRTRWKNFFIAYSHALKRQQNINTNIFAQHFKHIEIDTDDYFRKVVQYIHHNPKHHHIMRDWQNYKWSSYGRILNDHKSKLEKKYVLDLFGGKDQYIQSHLDYAKNFNCGFDDF